MITKLDMKPIVEKTEELCLSFLNQPAFNELKQMIENFLANDEATEKYERIVSMQQELRQKQQRGLQLTQEEIDDFEREEYLLYKNDVIREFLYAQNEFQKLHDTISRYVVRSVELERIPEEADLNEGCGCGSGGEGCGCGGHGEGECGCGHEH